MSIPENGKNRNRPISARVAETARRIIGDCNRFAPEDQLPALIEHLRSFGESTGDELLLSAVVREVARLARLDPYALTKHIGKPSAKPASTVAPRIFTLRELRSREVTTDTGESLPLFGVHGIIRRGRTHLLSGKPRVGKTEALLRGGVLQWREARVLYLSEENEDDWNLRLSAFEEEELPEGVEVWFASGVSREAILRQIEQGSYAVVIVDTLRNVWRLADELHPSRLVEDLVPLIDLQRRLGFTLICLHHERKSDGELVSDRAAGTNALSAMHDMLLSLSPKGENQLLLTYEGRTTRGGNLLLEWREGELRCLGEADSVEFRTLAQRVEGVIYTAREPLTTKQVHELLGEPRPSLRHLHDVLQHLQENGRIEREPRDGGRGTTFRWKPAQTLFAHIEGGCANLLPSPERQPEKVCTEPIYSANKVPSCRGGEEDPFASAETPADWIYDPVAGRWHRRRGGNP